MAHSPTEVAVKSLKDLASYDLSERIEDVFTSAKSQGQLIYSGNTESEIIQDDKLNMTIELKIVEGLGKRPLNRPTEPGTKEKISNERIEKVKSKSPFMKPEPELTLVNDLVGDYRLILNKFPNNKDHFLMVTKEFVQQDTLLKPIELQLMYTILKNLNTAAKKNAESKYFAFFNTGPESGYSQFHKHMQFMRLPDSKDYETYQSRLVSNSEFYIPNEANPSKRPLFNKSASFKHLILKLPSKFEDENEQEGTLAMLYMYLIKRVLNVFKENDLNRSQVSYNFLMMDDWMMIVPRRAAKYDGVWQNSLGYMGLFSAKNEEVKNKMLSLGFDVILKECGFELEEDEESIVYNEYGY